MFSRLRHLLAGRRARLRFDRLTWEELIVELERRGEGRRESGAFLLAPRQGGTDVVSRLVFLDDLDPNCLVGGIHFDGKAYSELWSICDREQMRVVADVHTHPGDWVGQSPTDRENPMVARRSHIALIVPRFARPPVDPSEIGVHEYRGEKGWVSHFGRDAQRLVYVGRLA